MSTPPNRSSRLLFPTIAVLVLVCVALPFGLPRPALAAQEKLFSAHGVVDAWRLEQDGMLYVRVAVRPRERIPIEAGAGKRNQSHEAGEGRFWFRTPADQTDQTHFEDLLLTVVLQSRSSDSLLPETLTIYGENDPADKGETWQDAYEIKALSQP